MKATGITRRVDDLGRVVLPVELRRNLGIDVGDALEIFTENDMIVLRRYNAVDDLLTIANRLKDKVSVEGYDGVESILMDKLAEIEKIILSGRDKH